eukprot:CAMPEP_0195303306 /NCGR_PEP_ID=MMETSP0707-20130614/32581_1 /TAXON_ID=33640 /ORGANISM="Asterionellopsis glacialis, Strain CCMP134" /LENGTH=272 /DNA_ID=CAMNT_0040366811 /DNA_START=48 /DNA_END=866 /DNA_ORIENTATION=-
MNTLFVATIVLGVCIFHVDAFLSPTQIYHPRTKISPSSSSILRQRHHHPGTFPPLHVSKEPQYPPEEKDSSSRVLLTHDDIVWKLRPPPETPFLRQVLVRLGANLIRLDCLWKGQDPPLVLCPKVGGTAVLEAHYQHTRIARFGLTTQRGPSAPPIEETVQEIYDIQQLPLGGIGAAAIIYMVVEPPYRRLGVGTLALEVIAAIHAIQGCDFTMLVADDNGSGKLVQWYETNGFTVAPQLQTLMGSPDGQFGTSMIAPTKESLSTSCRIQWW